MTLGYDGELYILAFDHRGSFQKKLFGISGTPTAEETGRISEAKGVILDGFLKAHGQVEPAGSGGILIDEQFGAELARRGQEQGAVLAMPVEASGREEFDFEYGDEFGTHIESFNPTFSKVLVRYNPDDDADSKTRQLERLRRLSDWLHGNNRKFLFELLVPASQAQLASVNGDADRFDRELRPDLVVESIGTFQEAGVEADVWKIEGLDDGEDCRRVANQARSGGRDRVVCVVLGRGASRARVDHWLQTGARVSGYCGFAIGRTIWWDALSGLKDATMDRNAAVELIAANYLRSIATYRSAAS